MTEVDPNATPTPPSGPDLNATLTQTVNGQEVTLPLKDWVALGNKWKGIDGDQLVGKVGNLTKLEQALQTAANEQANAEARLEAQRLIFTRAGLPAATIDERIAAMREALTQPEEPTPTNPDGGVRARSVIDPALKRAIERLEYDQARNDAEKFYGKIQDSLNSDKDLNVYYEYVRSQRGEDGLKAFQKMLTEEGERAAYEAMERRKNQGETFNHTWFDSAIPEAKRRALSLLGNTVGAPSSLGRAAGVNPEQDLGFKYPDKPLTPPTANASEIERKDYLTNEFLRSFAGVLRGGSSGSDI